MQALQADQLSLATLRLLPALQATPSDHPLAAEAQRALRNFDGVMRADGPAPLIFTAWVDELTRQVVGGRLGAERFKPLYGKRQFRNALEDMLARDDKAWCGSAGCAVASARALDAALTQLAQRHGSRVAGWRWGAAHPAVSRHNPLSKVKPLAKVFEVRVPTGGDPFTVNVGQYQLDDPAEPYANRHAASLRAVYDLANLDNSGFIYQTGQSGNVWSPRYRDMATEWAAVRYRPLQLAPLGWVHTLTLLP
jgi:penicillin amidase